MFGTSGIRGKVGTDVTADVALAVGRAVASDGAKRVVVGRDVRESGELLTDAVTAGLRECGADVVVVGVASTPTVARAVARHDADAGVVVTASHNPAPDNGFKLWNPNGMAYTEEQRQRISRRIREEDYDLKPWDELGSLVEVEDAVDRHVEDIVEAVGSLPELSVVVDVGNGTGLVSALALDRLGCRVTTLNAQPDGRFPGRPSEPTEETLSDLAAYVAAAGADLGVGHDGDADRMMAIADDGRFVPKDLLLALFARFAAGDGDRVVVPVDTSLAVDDALAPHGVTVDRTKVGDVYIAERAAEVDAAFGGEPSGAWIWPEETYCPDGPLAAAKLAELVAERGSLSELLAAFNEYPLRRGNVETDDKAGVMERLTDAVTRDYDDVETIDGVRVAFDDGWFLVRASGTEPVVRVTAEARDPDRSEELFELASEYVEKAQLVAQ